MIKVFLSHKSQDKGFVRMVASKLEKGSIEFDEVTFEETQKNLDEIYRGLDESGVFVFFISKKALESTWCIREVLGADERLFKGRLNRFIPVIIDKDIQYNNPLIPQWMREQYNLKYISKPTVVATIIRRALRIATWDLFPHLKVRDIHFAGRNEQIRLFEERYHSIDLGKPLCCIISGLTSIGRRSFLYHVLGKTNSIKYGYVPRYIYLNKADSIESFILYLYGAGFTEKDQTITEGLTAMPMDQKVILAVDLLKELDSCKDKLFIIDEYSIVYRDGKISDWFLLILARLNISVSQTLICVVCQIRPNWQDIRNHQEIFTMDMPPMIPSDRVSLFDMLLEEEDIFLTKEEKKEVCSIFTGYPEQEKYAVSLIKEESKDYLLSHLHELSDYVDQLVGRLIANMENSGENTKQLLILLSVTESLSAGSIVDILGIEEKEVLDIIKTLSRRYIIEFIGTGNEYICLNDAVKNYFQREGYELDHEIHERFIEYLKKIVNTEDILEVECSDYMLSLKESLKSGILVDERKLIPTHYLAAIYETYRERKNYPLVITLSQKVLQNEKYLDKQLVNSVRYHLCLALSRLRKREALAEIQKHTGATHYYLLGFYYRMMHRHKDAITAYNSALDINPRYYQAKRDLVNSMISTENYEDALDIVVELYEERPKYPFIIQSYIRCLMHTRGSMAKEYIMLLLKELERIPNTKAKEMYMTSLALYMANIENDINNALLYADDAIGLFPQNIYPYLTKLEILSKTQNAADIKETIDEVDKIFSNDSPIRKKFPYLACKCLLYAFNGEERYARKFIEENIIPLNFSDKIQNRLSCRITEICNPQMLD